MFDISAKNKSPKPPELYSMLNPETSSDSPSAKSKGARFVSEMIVIVHINKRGRHNRERGYLPLALIKYPFPKNITVSKQKIKEIS